MFFQSSETSSSNDKSDTVSREWKPEELAFLENCYVENRRPNYVDIARQLRALLARVKVGYEDFTLIFNGVIVYPNWTFESEKQISFSLFFLIRL